MSSQLSFYYNDNFWYMVSVSPDGRETTYILKNLISNAQLLVGLFGFLLVCTEKNYFFSRTETLVINFGDL